MKPALLLIDLQQDFLAAPALEPAAGQVVSAAGWLLAACRQRNIPVVHVWTTVQRDPDQRMPHWKAAGQWRCVQGTPGHAPPAAVRPVEGERIIHKQFFSGFGAADLAEHLQKLPCDTLILAGVHLHGCVRATALDAYGRGLQVWIADDAVASDDPIHAAITRRYLARRAARFVPVAQVPGLLDGVADGACAPASAGEMFTHRSPTESGRVLWQIPIAGPATIGQASAAAQRAGPAWRQLSIHARADLLRRWAAGLRAATETLAHQIVEEIGKPSAMARAEIGRSAEILAAVADRSGQELRTATGSAAYHRYEPLGVVAIVTPYNNPVAIPAGKIGPALLYGNTVVWKPAPAAAMLAQRMVQMARAAGLPEDVLTLCLGDQTTAQGLAADPRIDGVTISGSAGAGYALQEQCARRHIPFQAELGGNNAAIVWDDATLPVAARAIAEGAFGFAGQRCTANRRVIVAGACGAAFLRELEQATARLVWGDPRASDTVVGPLISVAKRDAIGGLVERAAAGGQSVLVPHRQQANYRELCTRGAFHPPAIVVADDPAREIVQEESFGPVLVVQRAIDFEEALALCNGVRQGLVAALFSSAPALQERFLQAARCGVLKLNRATADADAVSPLGGWKASGVGPAEHGPSDREFYCRVQTIYGA